MWASLSNCHILHLQLQAKLAKLSIPFQQAADSHQSRLHKAINWVNSHHQKKEGRKLPKPFTKTWRTTTLP
uniref:Uncharacterized protein n=1 Tax=Populus trichocarpa TaxID=3694 RepID=A0A2K1R7T9_POPTR